MGRERSSSMDVARPSRQAHGLLLALSIVAGVVFVYAQTLRFDFTNWDDDHYVTDNARLRPLSAAEVVSQFSRFEMGNYHPLTMLSFASDLRLGGKSPAYFHAVAIALHLIDTGLVFLFVHALARDRAIAFLTAAIFALHPTHVESVAWVSSRKDLLFTAFGLGCLLAYCRYAQSGHRGALTLAFGLFGLSSLSKGMAVSIVPTLVLIDWQLGRPLRARSLWLEKIPFVVLALVVGLVAIEAQRAAQSIRGYEQIGLATRLVLAGGNAALYLVQQIVPVELRPFYAHPDANAFPASYLGLCLLLLPLGAWLASTGCPRLVRFGVLFFVVNIALVLQVLPFGMALRADRYTYFAGVGSALALATGIAALGRRWPRCLLPAALVCASILALLAHQQCRVWRNSLVLWNEVIRTTPAFGVAYGNRGAAHLRQREYDLAERDLLKAVELAPGDPNHYVNLGAVAAKRGHYGMAVSYLQRALALRPFDTIVHSNLAWVLTHLGEHAAAIREADQAMASDAANAFAYANRGQARLGAGDREGAAADFERAIALRPDLADGYYRRAFLHVDAGDSARACTDLRTGRPLPLMDEELAPRAVAIWDTTCAGGR